MSLTYEKANKIRTKLLLFIDNEILNRFSNIPYFHKNLKKKNNVEKIELEETFSNFSPEISVVNSLSTLTNESTNNSISQTETKRSQKLKKYSVNDSISACKEAKKILFGEDVKKDINFANKKYVRKDQRRNTSTLLLINNIKINKKLSSKYLMDLCDNLIKKTKTPKILFAFSPEFKKRKNKLTYKKCDKKLKLNKDNNKVININSSKNVKKLDY